MKPLLLGSRGISDGLASARTLTRHNGRNSNFMPAFVRGVDVTSVTFAVPNNVDFCGAVVTLQGWFQDPGPTMGIAHTPGLEVTFGTF